MGPRYPYLSQVMSGIMRWLYPGGTSIKAGRSQPNPAPTTTRYAHRSRTCPSVLSEDDRADHSHRQVGVAARLPSSPDNPNDLDYRAFWDFLIQKGQARGKMPAERLQGISYVVIR